MGAIGRVEASRAIQDEIDDLAAALGRSVSLDLPTGELIGYSTRGTDVDPARLEAILTRRVPDAVLDHQRRHDVDRATRPVHVPANAELGMTSRTCLPLRRGSAVVAYLWVLDEHGPEQHGPDEHGHDQHGPVAAADVDLLLDHSARILESLRPDVPPDVGALLSELFDRGPGPDLLDHLTRDRGPQTHRSLAVVVLSPGPTPVTGVSPGHGPPRAPVTVPGELGRCTVEERTLLLIGVGSSAAVGPVLSRLTGAGRVVGHSPVIALGGPRNDLLAQLSMRAAQAVVAADCAAVDPYLPALAGWDDLGLYRRLLLGVGAPQSWPDRLPVPAEDRSEPMLRHTLETYLDHAGDAGRSIAALGVHRTTFYYRLGRLSEAYGARLDDGLARTELHLALKTHRLALARDRRHWSAELIARLAPA